MVEKMKNPKVTFKLTKGHATSIGNGPRSRPKNKHKRLSWKKHQKQGR